MSGPRVDDVDGSVDAANAGGKVAHQRNQSTSKERKTMVGDAVVVPLEGLRRSQAGVLMRLTMIERVLSDHRLNRGVEVFNDEGRDCEIVLLRLHVAEAGNEGPIKRTLCELQEFRSCPNVVRKPFCTQVRLVDFIRSIRLVEHSDPLRVVRSEEKTICGGSIAVNAVADVVAECAEGGITSLTKRLGKGELPQRVPEGMRNDACLHHLTARTVRNHRRELTQVANEDYDLASEGNVRLIHEITQKVINDGDDILMEHADLVNEKAVRLDQENALMRLGCERRMRSVALTNNVDAETLVNGNGALVELSGERRRGAAKNDAVLRPQTLRKMDHGGRLSSSALSREKEGVALP